MNPFTGAVSSSGGSISSGAESAVDRWPMFHKDLMHTGNSKSKAPDTNQILWKFNTGGQVGSPVVVGGLVYVGSEDCNIYALDTSNGAQIWNYTTDYFVDTDPAVSNGIVYVGSVDNKVYALNATTGTVTWNYTTDARIVMSSPAVANEIVYVGSLDNKVYALNASTGAYMWSYKTGDMVVSSPAVADGIVYVGSYDHLVYAFGPSPSEQIYSIPPSIILLLIMAILLVVGLLAVAIYRRKH
jgi:outer membrane protein assembly factor BamB